MARIAGIKPRRGTTAEWAAANAASPSRKLDSGELGYDSTTKDLVVGDGTTAFASLPKVGSGTYARPSAGNLAVAMGDSITSAGGGADGQLMEGWFPALAVRSMGRIRFGGAYAAGGYTLEQMETEFLPLILALSPRPSACVVFGGTNNTGANSGGGVGSGFDFTASKATLRRICDGLMGGGILPVLTLIPIRLATDTVGQANIVKWNQWIVQYATSRGFRILDAFRPLTDPSTNQQYATLTLDGVHPNPKGYTAIAEHAIAQGLHETFPPAGWFPSQYNDAQNLLLSSRGLFLTNTGGVGTAWAVGGGGASLTSSIVAPDPADNLKGNWQRLTRAAGGTGNVWLYTSFTGWSVGDRLRFSARVRTSGMEAGSGSYSVYVKNTAHTTVWGMGPTAWTQDLADGLLQVDFTVPSTSTGSEYLYLQTGSATGSDTVLDVGEVTVVNLTTQGVLTP